MAVYLKIAREAGACQSIVKVGGNGPGLSVMATAWRTGFSSAVFF
jgi:hypothetical protein